MVVTHDRDDRLRRVSLGGGPIEGLVRIALNEFFLIFIRSLGEAGDSDVRIGNAE